jgi:F420-dependent oxidoreductase-like protein
MSKQLGEGSTAIRLSLTLDYTQDVAVRAAEVERLDAAGLDAVWIQEGYSFDAVSAIGYLAGRTRQVRLGTAILNVYSRTPALLAMTAAGCDALSAGRFVLGLGTSGPQVIAGFHGVPFELPLARMRETTDICRMVWRRQPLVYPGRTVQVPHGATAGSPTSRGLKLVNAPARSQIPIYWAAMGDRSVASAAELADGWLPFFYVPERAEQAFGPALRDGLARRDPVLGDLEVVAPVTVAIGDDLDAEALLDRERRRIALYVGGMGKPGANFYHDLAVRMGWGEAAATIRELFSAGRRGEAAAAVPADWLAGAGQPGGIARTGRGAGGGVRRSWRDDA